MATSIGVNDFLIFKRGETCDDVWDDTALIKAYDEAVSAIKAKMSTHNPAEFSRTKPKSTQAKKKKSNKNKNKKYKWKVGDSCVAVFTEDGLPYPAEILSLNNAEGTCFVRYTMYGNEEQHNLSDLMLVTRKDHNNFVSDLESDVEWHGQGQASNRQGDNSTRLGNSPAQSKKSDASHPPQWPHQMYNNAMLPPPPMCFPGFQPPNYWSNKPMSPNPPFPMVPPIPPPPPPMTFDSPDDGDADGLCSMLMSWYMSGYHTGYYQGLKDARKRYKNLSYFHQ